MSKGENHTATTTTTEGHRPLTLMSGINQPTNQPINVDVGYSDFPARHTLALVFGTTPRASERVSVGRQVQLKVTTAAASITGLIPWNNNDQEDEDEDDARCMVYTLDVTRSLISLVARSLVVRQCTTYQKPETVRKFFRVPIMTP
jgi:hypothetical protein